MHQNITQVLTFSTHQQQLQQQQYIAALRASPAPLERRAVCNYTGVLFARSLGAEIEPARLHLTLRGHGVETAKNYGIHMESIKA